MRLLGTLHQLDDTRGAVRVEDVYDTDIDDLWAACTDPDRLARWIADVSGELRQGGTFAGVFTSGFEGAGRIEVCERPSRLVLSTWDNDAPEQVSTIEVALTEEGDRTRLVVEERGIPLAQARSYGAGWQVHAEDLAAYVSGGERDEDPQRWKDAVEAYRDEPVEAVA
ncbi:SRPBCC family protein [Nocardioides baculatus]|uniref:SRPBCC family protein n=1 Tax=Nocardioides baculatus TaxID=2801337 RepID=A0ABS1LBN6_9ACTN|nr:SRPBCC family protein [Nocardioides baculatus]MBL0747951.1 SRPBCC family protein [Nocardioides baculatus]